MSKKWFTLIELIVVVTILAILWTVAFVSFQWYTSDSRDSVRLADTSTIRKGMEVDKISTWEYPSPTNPTAFTDWSSTLWNAGTFGKYTISSLKTLRKAPLDPETKAEYEYSLASNGKEY